MTINVISSMAKIGRNIADVCLVESFQVSTSRRVHPRSSAFPLTKRNAQRDCHHHISTKIIRKVVGVDDKVECTLIDELIANRESDRELIGGFFREPPFEFAIRLMSDAPFHTYMSDREQSGCHVPMSVTFPHVRLSVLSIQSFYRTNPLDGK